MTGNAEDFIREYTPWVEMTPELADRIREELSGVEPGLFRADVPVPSARYGSWQSGALMRALPLTDLAQCQCGKEQGYFDDQLWCSRCQGTTRPEMRGIVHEKQVLLMVERRAVVCQNLQASPEWWAEQDGLSAVRKANEAASDAEVRAHLDRMYPELGSEAWNALQEDRRQREARYAERKREVAEMRAPLEAEVQRTRDALDALLAAWNHHRYVASLQSVAEDDVTRTLMGSLVFEGRVELLDKPIEALSKTSNENARTLAPVLAQQARCRDLYVRRYALQKERDDNHRTILRARNLKLEDIESLDRWVAWGIWSHLHAMEPAVREAITCAFKNALGKNILSPEEIAVQSEALEQMESEISTLLQEAFEAGRILKGLIQGAMPALHLPEKPDDAHIRQAQALFEEAERKLNLCPTPLP